LKFIKQDQLGFIGREIWLVAELVLLKMY